MPLRPHYNGREPCINWIGWVRGGSETPERPRFRATQRPRLRGEAHGGEEKLLRFFLPWLRQSCKHILFGNAFKALAPEVVFCKHEMCKTCLLKCHVGGLSSSYHAPASRFPVQHRCNQMFEVPCAARSCRNTFSFDTTQAVITNICVPEAFFLHKNIQERKLDLAGARGTNFSSAGKRAPPTIF